MDKAIKEMEKRSNTKINVDASEYSEWKILQDKAEAEKSKESANEYHSMIIEATRPVVSSSTPNPPPPQTPPQAPPSPPEDKKRILITNQTFKPRKRGKSSEC